MQQKSSVKTTQHTQTQKKHLTHKRTVFSDKWNRQVRKNRFTECGENVHGGRWFFLEYHCFVFPSAGNKWTTERWWSQCNASGPKCCNDYWPNSFDLNQQMNDYFYKKFLFTLFGKVNVECARNGYFCCFTGCELWKICETLLQKDYVISG